MYMYAPGTLSFCWFLPCNMASMSPSPIYTVKPVLSGHLKIDKTKILMTNGSKMKVESIAECSPNALSDNRS